MGRNRVLAAVATAALVLGTPGAAFAADDDGPSVHYALSDLEGDTGVLLVAAAAPRGVASVHADVKGQDGAVLASSDGFALREGTAESGVWASTAPFTLPALGYYPVEVTVTDTAGGTATGEGALSYVVRAFYDGLRLRPAAVTYEQRSVTVSGVLKGARPGGRVERLAGAEIEVAGRWDAAYVTTDADGRFSGTVPISFENERVTVNYNFQNPDHLNAFATVGNVRIKPRATRVTAKLSAKRVDAGESVTVSGVASWRTPSGWEPVAAGTVGIDGYGSVPVDATGAYSLTVTPSASATLHVQYAIDDDPFVARSSRDVAVTVIQPAG